MLHCVESRARQVHGKRTHRRTAITSGSAATRTAQATAVAAARTTVSSTARAQRHLGLRPATPHPTPRTQRIACAMLALTGLVCAQTDARAATNASARPTAISVKTSDGQCQFVTAGSAVPVLQCLAGRKVRWRYQQQQDAVAPNGLLVADGLLLAVRYQTGGSGAVIDAYELQTGERRWRNYTIGVGPVVHSAYENEITARVQPEPVRPALTRASTPPATHAVTTRLVIHGNETGGRYVEEFLVSNGQRVRLARFVATATPPQFTDLTLTATQQQVPFAPPATPPATGVASGLALPAAAAKGAAQNAGEMKTRNALGLLCAYKPNAASATMQSLICHDVYGKEAWRIDLAQPFARDVAMAATDTELLVCRYHRNVSGVTATAYDLHTGRERWSTRLYGVGPAPHSKWWNEVTARVEAIESVAQPSAALAAGSVSPQRVPAFVITGAEPSGNYIEVLEAKTGRTLGWRMP